MNAHKDMTGLWSGEYRYDSDDGCVSFTAAITETGKLFRGTTLEEADLTWSGKAGEYQALIRGDRCGQHVWFTKTYAPSSGIRQLSLLYSGSVNRSFTQVAGRWAVMDTPHIHGSFTLTRVTTRIAATMALAAAAPS